MYFSMPDAIAVAGLAVGGGLPLAVAIMKYGQFRASGNGRGSVPANVVTEPLCQARQETIAAEIKNLDAKIEAVERNLGEKIDAVGQLIKKQG